MQSKTDDTKPLTADFQGTATQHPEYGGTTTYLIGLPYKYTKRFNVARWPELTMAQKLGPRS